MRLKINKTELICLIRQMAYYVRCTCGDHCMPTLIVHTQDTPNLVATINTIGCKTIQYDCDEIILRRNKLGALCAEGIEIPAEYVNMYLFWRTILDRGTYGFILGDTAMPFDRKKTIVVTPDRMHLDGQNIVPCHPFHIHGYMKCHLTVRGLLYSSHMFIALSLAINGAHLVY